MQDRPSTADAVFAALANPTRREVLDLLRERPHRASRIAERFDMARPSVSEHLKVLRTAGLVSEVRQGRQRVYSLEPEPLADVAAWLAPYERFWQDALISLRDLLAQERRP